MLDKLEIQNWFMELQNSICEQIQNTDGGAKFTEDKWDREEGGGGRSRVIVNGNILAKAGVNFSAVWGKTPQNVLKALHLPESDFFATGVSIVMHPNSPMVPIIHMNVRYFEMSNGTYWFGGGIDLTPHYVNNDDAQFFHKELKKVCDYHNSEYYTKFKQWADDYFYIKHRNETRGVGGIFFDHLSENENVTKKQLWGFVQDVGSAFAPIYSNIMKKNANIPYSEHHKKWQLLRRGRYVEFNLVYDKGTKFGLDTNGRTESILMSMPPEAQWVYNYKVEPQSEEEKTINLLKKGIEWA